MEQGITFETRSGNHGLQVRFERRDWLALLAVLVSAAGYAFLHPSIFADVSLHMPGIGLTVSCWLLLAVCMGYIGWSRLKWSPLSIFLFASTLLLSATYGIFAQNILRLMNFPVLIGLFILTVYSLKGSVASLSSGLLATAARQMLRSIIRYLPLPAQAVRSQLRTGSNRRFKELLLGVGICIPVIGLVILLLSDADSIFGNLMVSLFSSIRTPDVVHFVWNLVRLLVLALLAFAFIYGLNSTLPSAPNTGRRRSLPKITIVTVLTAMGIVYAAFVYIQCRYLFAGSENAVMEGGYAVYARSGFFQLVFVAFITMLIVLPALWMMPESRCVRILCAFVSLLTLVIVCSAFWRMRLYILEYGLTLLRAVTLWGILAITAAMIATLIKATRPQIRIFRLLFVFTICTWIMFNYTNVYARIADYNVAAYRSGTIETLDIGYLKLLGVEAKPQLDALREENTLPVELMGEVIQARAYIMGLKSAPYDWSLSWLKAQ